MDQGGSDEFGRLSPRIAGLKGSIMAARSVERLAVLFGLIRLERGALFHRLFLVGVIGWSARLLLGCAFEAPPSEVSISPVASIVAVATKVAVATNTPRPSTATSTSLPTSTRTAAPTRTTVPTLTPLPTSTPSPTATTDPQLAGVGYCRQTFGSTEGTRFSGRLMSIQAERLDLIDQVTLTFSDTVGLLHGSAACLAGEQWADLAGTNGAAPPGEALIAINLDDWAHDAAWRQSPVTMTQTLTGTASLARVSFSSDPLASRGTTIGVGLRRVAPFRIRLEEAPPRIVLEVAHTARSDPRDDTLFQPAGRVDTPDQPIFFLQNYDVWQIVDGRTEPLTTTTELETALAVSPDGETLAVCRAPAETDPANLPYQVRASLWVIRINGVEERQLADTGGCADLQFAPNGRTLSFTVNTAAAAPTVLSVWTVPVVVGDPRPASPVADEWDRFGAAWLPDNRLIYLARNQSGQTVLVVREADGSEREISAQLLTGPRYRGIGQFVVGENLIALEALRSGDDGADMVLLRFDGGEVAVERRGFWQRPLAFLPDGLLYLSARCASNVAHEYTLLRRDTDGTIADLLSGSSTAGIGEAVVVGNTMLMSRYAQPIPGIRGPQAVPADGSPASIWAIPADLAGRRELYRAPVPVMGIGVARP